MKNDKLLSISIVHSTMTEILAVLISRLSFVMLKRHRFIFNMGDISQSDSTLMLNLCFELVGEAFVDVLCLYTEKKRGIPVSHIFVAIENKIHLLVRFFCCCRLRCEPLWTVCD